MKVSHVLYKVNDLEKAVAEFEAEGFVVEYGTAKNPYNALVYFSDGPYLELFQNSGMPGFIKTLLRFFGNGAMVDRMEFWEQAGEGLIGLALENYEMDLKEEIAVLKRHRQKFFKVRPTRKDTKGRVLRYTCVFPDEMQIPFFMTYFSVDPKPKDFTHPNGIRGIKSISFGTREELIPIINELCDDSILKL